MSHESYVAAEAFAGQYQFLRSGGLGLPLGAKATLKIIEHQGTPQETLRQETLVLDSRPRP